MEVNYLMIIVTTAIACCFIFFLTWKNRRDLRNYEQDRINSEIDPEREERKRLQDQGNSSTEV
jgi:hypothetical protein